MPDYPDYTEELSIPGLDVVRVKRYSRIRLATFAMSALLTAAEMAWFAFSGRSGRFEATVRTRVPRRASATAAYTAAVVAASWATTLPWAYVAGHGVERRFDLTTQSGARWLEDRVKALAVSLALETPVIVGAYEVIRRRPRDWWLVLSGAAIPVAVVLSNLAPVVIMPLFNRFDPIDDEELETRIRALGKRAGVPIAAVYRMDMSRQTEKANAFFTGIGKTKRIVLADTLIDRYSPEEIEAVVAHELGHQAHGDIWRMIAFGSVATLTMAYGVNRLAPLLIRHTAAHTGVKAISEVASLPLLGLVAGAFGVVMTPVNAGFSRAIERRTDRFALKLTGNGRAYAATMERLATQNLADPSPHPLLVFLLYSHPPVAERIALARGFEQALAEKRDRQMRGSG